MIFRSTLTKVATVDRSAARIHPTALIGKPAQWRGREAEATKYPVEIHDTASVGAYTCIDAGCERPTKVGRDTIIQKQVHCGHGVQIGRGCDIASGTVIAGEVTIGDFVRIGIGALISPYVTIGDSARVGAGAVVIKDVESGSVVAGNPAKHLRWLNDDERAYALQLMLACP